tara:strand:- start:3093 stop:4793 length:1701 start_codon:yes stop_codon:yes gene_type:complete
MKIARIYYKPPNPDNNQPERAYIRRQSGSILVALAFCPNEAKYRELISSNLLMKMKSAMQDRYRAQLLNYDEGRVSFISNQIPSDCTSIGQIRVEYSTALQDIYFYLSSPPSFEIEDYDLIGDVIRCYTKWGYGIPYIAQNISDRNPVVTEDGHTTKFYKIGHSNSYYHGDCADGFFISMDSVNSSSGCSDCDYIEYDNEDGSDYLCYIECADGYVCESCRDNYYVCNGCDEYVHSDYVNWNEESDTSYCESCYENNDDSANIHSYNYTPNYLKFYDYVNGKMKAVHDYRKTKVPYYGAELEVECKTNDRVYYVKDISRYGGEHEKYFYCKQDGSLNHGFEICFMPMTFYAIKNLDLYDSILKHRGRSQLQSYNTDTCGMHIHINREAFSDHHLFKFISFVHEFKSLIYLISQRKRVRELNSFSKFNNGFKDRAKKEMVDSIKSKKRFIATNKGVSEKPATKYHSTTTYGDKYVPVNLQHRETIEVRIFKGNLMENSIRKNFEFVDCLYYFTRENPIYRLRVQEFLDFCTTDRKKYPNLNGFLETNKSKVKDIVRFPLDIPEGLDY